MTNSGGIRTHNLLLASQEWLLQLVDQAFLSVGFDPQPEDRTVDRLTRAVVSAWACDLSHPMCVEYAAAAFPKWLHDGDR